MSDTVTSTSDIDALPEGISKRSRALLMQLIRPYRGVLIVLTLLVLFFATAGTLGPVFIARALDHGLPAATHGNFGPLWTNVGLFAAFVVLGAAASWAATRGIGVVSQKIMVTLRGRLFDHVQKLDIAYHEKQSSGRLVSRQSSDMESVQEFLGYSLISAISGVVQMAVIAAILIFLDIPLALVTFAGFIPLYFVTRAAQRSQRAAYRRTRTSIAKVIIDFTESMGGIRAVQTFRRQPQHKSSLSAHDDDYRKANTDALQGVATFAGLTRLIGNLSQFAIILLGAWLVISGHTQVGVLAAFVLYVRRFYGPLDELVQTFNMYQSAQAALEKITAVLEVEPTITDPTSPQAVEVEGQVVFDGVRFAYGDGEDVLPRFDLRLPAGQTVALVGATGAGKSTLVKLLTRFYDPLEGAVKLDGVDLRDIADADLRKAIVMVTQESFLFGGTIADNIRIGRPDASDDEVRAAARAVGVDEFIESLPDGYDTDVRKRGGRLSSGQRQLVSFARVFLADPAVLVLDEATAHLDVPSEKLVQQALETILAGRTAVIIAHRLSTVEIADRVLVMDAGRIVEDGTPAELIAGEGRFAHLHAAWKDSLL